MVYCPAGTYSLETKPVGKVNLTTMTAVPFGNDPRKTERYRSLWNRDDVTRPLVGFCLVGWFPMGEFPACGASGDDGYLTPEMIAPEEFMEDHVRIIREGESMDDDAIRGAFPTQAVVLWMPGIVGAKVRVLPGNVLGQKQRLSWVSNDSGSLIPGTGNDMTGGLPH